MPKGKRQIAQPPILKAVPTVFDLQAAMKDMAQEAFGTVVQIMRTGDNENNRLAASKMLIEYVAGKPSQTVQMNGNVKLEILSQEQRDAAMKAMLYGEPE